jgi:signal peptidase I
MVLALVGLTAFAVLAWAAVALRRRYLVAVVRGSSMEPTLRTGDRLLVRRRTVSGIRGGDVVVFRDVFKVSSRNGWAVKRVIAVPGEPVPRDRVSALARATEAVVPAGRLVVLGDNPTASFDSRQFGYLPAEAVVGAAVRPSAERRNRRASR